MRFLFAVVQILIFIPAISIAQSTASPRPLQAKAPEGKNCEVTVRVVTKSERISSRTYWSYAENESACSESASRHQINLTPQIVKEKSAEARFVK